MRWTYRGDEVALLIRKGAEASIFLEEWYGRRVVMKTRLPKSYRVDPLDFSIRVSRTSREAHLLHDSKRAGVPTPTVYQVDTATCTIIMEYVEGNRLKEALPSMGQSELRRTCKHVGSLIGHLHSNGIVHGDLTTSNMILRDGAKLFFIDFGLSDYSREIEPKGVDLLLMSRALKSTHFALHSKAFEAVIAGYQDTVGKDGAKFILRKMHEIETRGRYSERSQTAMVPDIK
jgi:TP53 regulating kinase-like protein